MRNWKTEKVIMLFIIVAGTVFLIPACQFFAKQKDYPCEPKPSLPQFWKDHKLPLIEGAVICSEYSYKESKHDYDKHGINLVHYHGEEKNFREFNDKYQEEFIKNGWLIQKTPLKESGAIYTTLEKDRISFVVTVADCNYISGRKEFRPCTLLTIKQGAFRLAY